MRGRGSFLSLTVVIRGGNVDTEDRWMVHGPRPVGRPRSVTTGAFESETITLSGLPLFVLFFVDEYPGPLLSGPIPYFQPHRNQGTHQFLLERLLHCKLLWTNYSARTPSHKTVTLGFVSRSRASPTHTTSLLLLMSRLPRQPFTVCADRRTNFVLRVRGGTSKTKVFRLMSEHLHIKINSWVALVITCPCKPFVTYSWVIDFLWEVILRRSPEVVESTSTFV